MGYEPNELPLLHPASLGIPSIIPVRIGCQGSWVVVSQAFINLSTQIGWSNLNYSIIIRKNIDRLLEMVYTYGMKHFGDTVAETNIIQPLLTIADESNRPARRAGCE